VVIRHVGLDLAEIPGLAGGIVPEQAGDAAVAKGVEGIET
jgi:hypothetical protein